MKKLLLLIVLACAGYYGYAYLQNGNQNPQHIENPVYAELRVDSKIEGRELNLVLFGEMVDEVDCRERFDRAWNKIIDGCAECAMKLSSCRTDLEPRYRRLFDDHAIHSTYLSFTKGSRYERNGRMVVYGLTSDEGDALCDAIRQQFQSRYEGTVACIRGRRD
jgi:hypothetical protein